MLIRFAISPQCVYSKTLFTKSKLANHKKNSRIHLIRIQFSSVQFQAMYSVFRMTDTHTHTHTHTQHQQKTTTSTEKPTIGIVTHRCRAATTAASANDPPAEESTSSTTSSQLLN